MKIQLLQTCMKKNVNPDEIMPCASNGTISWDVYAGVRRSTSSFHASSGQRIVLSVFFGGTIS